MNDFFSNDLTWMTCLNSNETRKQLYIEFNDESASYAYADDDFCLFKNFPHMNLVFPIINTRRLLNCTCTLIWLLKEWQNAENSIQHTDSVQNCFVNFEKRFKNCKFKTRLNLCFEQTENFASSVSSVYFVKYSQKSIYVSLIITIFKIKHLNK